MEEVIKGYSGITLFIDLSSRTVEERDIPQDILEKYIGGRGLATRLLMDNMPASADPLGPDSVVVIATTPITATNAPTTGRGHMVFKSPLTGTIGSSNSGGEWGAHLKRTGYDAVVICGVSAKPVIVFIDGGGADSVRFLDADEFWGVDVHKTSDAVLGSEERKGARGLFIGPAGERLVRFAAVMNEKNRAYGRGGPGAVFGSKKLKGLIVRGSRKMEPVNPDVFEAGRKHALYRLKAAPSTKRIMRALGTAGLVNLINWINMLPRHNFSTTIHEQTDLDKMSGEAIAEKILEKPGGCYRCPIMCTRHTRVGDQTGEGPEYETVVLLGPVLDIYDLETITTVNYLANELGMDTITLGGTIGAAMECLESGALGSDRLGKYKLAFGETGGLHDLVRAIAERDGIGDLLAEGSQRLTAECGAPQLSMSVKGLELPAYDPRASYTQALGFMTSPTGACHLRGGYSVSLAFFGGAKEIPRFSLRQSPLAVRNVQNSGIIQDSAGICRFTGYSFGMDVTARMLSGATGLDLSVEKLESAAIRISTAERLFNNAAGFTADDDSLPERFQKEPIHTDGADRVVSPENIKKLREGYYTISGWDSEGRPTSATLEHLGVDPLPV